MPKRSNRNSVITGLQLAFSLVTVMTLLHGWITAGTDLISGINHDRYLVLGAIGGIILSTVTAILLGVLIWLIGKLKTHIVTSH